jgi:hypothetical protein
VTIEGVPEGNSESTTITRTIDESQVTEGSEDNDGETEDRPVEIENPTHNAPTAGHGCNPNIFDVDIASSELESDDGNYELVVEIPDGEIFTGDGPKPDSETDNYAYDGTQIESAQGLSGEVDLELYIRDQDNGEKVSDPLPYTVSEGEDGNSCLFS